MTIKMAKASDHDISVAMNLCNALEALTQQWSPHFPQAIAKPPSEDDDEDFDNDNPEHCKRALDHLLELARSASMMRVIWGAAVMLHPRNRCVDPNTDTIEHHPDAAAGFAAKDAKPLADWQDDHGPCLWWKFPITEPPYSGTPLDTDWPGYHTHWTRFIIPNEPAPPVASMQRSGIEGSHHA